MFEVIPELEIGSVLEVSGTSVRIELSGDLSELSKTYGGHVYAVGQVGSLIKIHYGRRILLAYVRMLRMRSEEKEEERRRVAADNDSRVLEADLFGEGLWQVNEEVFDFYRGVKTYPLPGQQAYLATRAELREIYRGAQRAQKLEQEEAAPILDIGHYFGTDAVNCRLDFDRLFGHHSAVLGATGSGKSAAVAAVLHGLLGYERDPEREEELRPRVVLMDPHGEYAEAFGERAVVYRAYDMLPGESSDAAVEPLRLPYWLMNGEEFRDLVVGKTEFAATSENNIVQKALRHARLVERGWIEESQDWEGEAVADTDVNHPADPRLVDEADESSVTSYDHDTPDPFSLEEFERHIRQEQGMRKKQNKWQIKSPSKFSSHRSILDKLQVLKTDPRLQFMMEEYAGNGPSLSRIIRQFVGDIKEKEEAAADIRIIDISGLPNEVAGPLTAAIARLLFEYKIWQTREERERDPVLFICEEAHRYVPNRGEAQYKAAQTAVRRLAKEGRKYGIGLMLVSQRPGDVEETVLSQCNSWVILRQSNPTDQQYVAKFLPDSFGGLAGLLPALGRREAVVVGPAAALPARIVIRRLADEELPNSQDISFVEGWLQDPIGEEEIQKVVKRWRREDMLEE